MFSPLLRLRDEVEFRWEKEHQETFDDIKRYLANPLVLVLSVKGRDLKLYISASDSTIISMLVQEDDNGIKCAICYLSRVLNDVEIRYSTIETMCLCLYYSCTKLKYYMKSFNVQVLSHNNVIRFMLSKSILHSRIGKWILALTKFSLIFVPMKAIKGQIVVDFLADHSNIEILECFIGIKPCILYFDGSKDVGGSGIGVVYSNHNI